MDKNEPSRVTAPAKCSRCHAEIPNPVVCDYCKSVNPGAAVMDYFTLLGVPETFEIDESELRRRYLTLSRHAHPDFHVQEDPEVQQLHLRVSSTLNEAYQTLRDPASRAAYLIECLGGKSMAEDKSVPDGFLATMMMMREELEEACQDGNTEECKRLGKVLRTQHDGLLRRIGELFEQYQQAVACRAVTRGLLAEIRQQVNAVSYVKKLLSRVEEK
ncbi:MAG: Fe-S protein assembly co-chaperone HscB [Phycisphaerae bacterium]|nr:Fe-S protein assembly co-chaperone HscB [Phycisphaerae bacterium]